MAGGGTEISRAFVTLGAEVGNLQRGLQQGQQMVTGAVAGMQRSLSSIQGMFAALGVGVGFGALISQAKGMITEGMEAMDVQKQLEASLRSTGNAVGFTADQLATYATELQKVTTVGDEHIKQTMMGLLKYKSLSGETFKAAVKAALDFEAAGQGSARGFAQMFGRALEMPQRATMMLYRMGVQFTDTEKKRIKELVEGNKKDEARAEVLKKIQSAYSGVAQEVAKTDSGRIKQLTEATGDLRENIGIALMPLMVRWKELQMSAMAGLEKGIAAVTPMLIGMSDTWSKLNEMAGGWIGKGAMITAGAGLLIGAFLMLKSALMATVGVVVILAFKGIVGLTAAIGSAAIATTVFSAKLLINATIMLATLPASIASATAALVSFTVQTIAAGIAAGVTFVAQLAALWPVLLGVAAGIAIVAAGVYAFSQSTAWEMIARRGTDASERVKSAWSDAWDEIKSSTLETFTALKAAFEAGDLVGAMELVWLQIKQYWISGVTALKTTWTEFKSWMAMAMVSLGELITEGLMAPLRWINDKMADMVTKLSGMRGGEMLIGAMTGGMTSAQVAEMLDAMYPSKEDTRQRFADIQNTLNQDRDRAIKEGKQAEEDAMEELEQRRAELFNEAQRKEVAARMARLSGEPGAKKGAAGEEEGGAGKGSPFVGIAELNRKMQEALLGKGPLLTETEKQTDILEQIRDGEAAGPAAAGGGGPVAAGAEELPWQKRRREAAEKRQAAIDARMERADFMSVERQIERRELKEREVIERRKKREDELARKKEAIEAAQWEDIQRRGGIDAVARARGWVDPLNMPGDDQGLRMIGSEITNMPLNLPEPGIAPALQGKGDDAPLVLKEQETANTWLERISGFMQQLVKPAADTIFGT